MRYRVQLERHVIERAFVWVDADNDSDARQKALEICESVNEAPWHYEDFGEAQVLDVLVNRDV